MTFITRSILNVSMKPTGKDERIVANVNGNLKLTHLLVKTAM